MAAAERAQRIAHGLRSSMLAGFNSSSHRSRRGMRIDQAVLTAHDRYGALDYARVHSLGIRTVAESARWPVVETRAWRYDFSPLVPWLRAARRLDMEIVWTLLDGSWPAELAPMGTAFVRRFAMFARAFARFLSAESDRAPLIVPVQEITARAWLGGELAQAEPYLEDRGFELQVLLVRAAIAAADGVRDVIPQARILCVEPLFHVAPAPDHPEDVDAAQAVAARQFAALDMLSGRAWPQLGGSPRHFDLLGVTVYPNSQWYYRGPKYPGPPLEPGAPGWRPLRDQLASLASRYERPVVIAGTGRGGVLGPAWLRYVCREARGAMLAGVTVPCVGIAPILDCEPAPGEHRPVHGVWGPPDAAGRRSTDVILAEEIAIQRACFERFAASLRAARAAVAAGPGARAAAAAALRAAG
jgi:hypothetical protein